MAEGKQIVLPNGESYRYETLAVAPADKLEEVMQRGTPPALESLAGWEFKGYNTPDYTRLLGIRKFKKGFFRPAGALEPLTCVEGYNVKIRQNHSLSLPWEDELRQGRTQRFGFYEVRPVDLGDTDNRYPNAVLIDYGRSPRNPKADPSRLLRDYLVQVYPDQADLLLGKAFLSAGFFRICVGYFVLGRHNPAPQAEEL
ncbi:MAG: hypothetical protein FJ125_04680 [Deltaproteobacteria bacterium]|nr:hypothetical protein [Deltaproteobacteria bacterium]